ncbi:capsular exopolysaccharide synthesis family protein [Elusimicrobium posterum]|uniref:GumC family protein n=1 Tax=Elusimicrobium posterum TaxID=3116653 RepID=UPI003C72FF70
MNNFNDGSENEIDVSYYLGVVFKRFWLLCAFVGIGVTAAVSVNLLVRPSYEAVVLMMIDRENSGNIDNTTFNSWSSDEDYYRTQYKLLESRTLQEKVYSKLELAGYEEFSDLNKFKKHIKIKPIMRSRLLNLEVSSYDPALAAKIANTLAETFVEDNLVNRITMARDVINALESTQRSSAQQELLNSMPQVVNSDFIKKLKGDEALTEGELAKAEAKYTSLHPDVISLKRQLSAIQAKIDTETRRLIQSIKIELSGQFSGNNIRIIDYATVPEFPYFPRKFLNLLVGIAAGMMLGLLAVFVLEIMDTSVKSSEDLEAKLKMPFLGFVPYEKLKKKTSEYALMVKEGNHLTAEAVRNIRTMINFSINAEKTNAFLIASSLQGEGKTFFSSNIAVAFAQTGKKVLLVDGDLRRSRLHRVFKLSNELGLSNLWTSDEKKNTFEVNIQKTEVKNLNVMTSGIRPPNPAELLNTPLLVSFINWAKENYDLVIIDCPAVMPVSDTLLWGHGISNAVFVIKYSSTNAKAAGLIVKKMANAGIKVLGGVITSYRTGGIAYGKYNYYKSDYYSDKEEN